MITEIDARTVAVPLARPVAFARREIRSRHYTLVRIRDRDGVEGIGFCYGGNLAGSLVTHAVREALAPAVIGQSSLSLRGIWEELYQLTLLHGRAGSVMRALSALDVALWDLNARASNLPLWRYLGASRNSVPAYASGGYYQEKKTAEDLAAEMASYVALGFAAVKMKVGRGPPDVDECRVATVRDAIGGGVRLLLDANNAWRSVPEALEHIHRFEPYDVFWIEEPFGPDDVDNHARLARATEIAVATGEIEQGRWRHKAILDAGAASILQTDAAVCGGITEYLQVAATAASYGVMMAPHWFHDLHVHLVAAVPNSLYVEFFPDDEIYNFQKLIEPGCRIAAGGSLKVPSGAGLGFGFDLAAVEHFALDRWS